MMKKILEELLKFREERDWAKFHTPENLAKSIAIEAAELLENYQWVNQTPDLQNVKEELADIMSYCMLLCHDYDLDLETIMMDKIQKNKKKYPKDKAYGKSDKYTKL